jgi:glycosyltransferase involved in cell wall biosynthesis
VPPSKQSHPKKRILFIESNIDGTVGGSYFSLLYLVEGLDKNRYAPIVGFYRHNRLIPEFKAAGCDVVILTKPQPFDLSSKLPSFKNASNILNELILATLLIFQKLLNYTITFIYPIFKCCFFLKRRKIWLVHLNNTLLRPQEWIVASLFTNTNIVAHERGINSSFPRLSLFWSRHLKYIFCISKAVQSNLTNHGFPQEQIKLLYNGLDPQNFIAVKSKRQILKPLGIGNDSKIVGIVGNIKPWKGQEIVVQAMNIVHQYDKSARCLIVGGVSKNPHEIAFFEHLKSTVKALNLNDTIIFTGMRSDIPSIVNTLDVLIHASLAPEPFGRVLLEGMALNKPVITNDIGAGPEIVVDNETGLVVKHHDFEALANAILWILNNPEKAEEMGTRGRIRLEEHFHIRKHIERVETLYASI